MAGLKTHKYRDKMNNSKVAVMQTEKRTPKRELTTGEIITWTFSLYSDKFAQYVVPFLIAGIATGLLATALSSIIILPPSPVNPYSQETFAWLKAALLPSLELIFLNFIIWWIIAANIAQGIAVNFTKDLLESNEPSLQKSYSFAMSKLTKLAIAGVLTGIIIFAGFIAIIIPGIILGVIFSLVVPAMTLEGKGIFGSLTRSRLLVNCMWLKTFTLLLTLYVIIGAFAGLVTIVSLPLGENALLVSNILTAFILPTLPIGLTLHYYSIVAKAMQQELPTPTKTMENTKQVAQSINGHKRQ